METHPVLDVELAELAVSLHAAGGAGHLLHEGAQLHGLGDQGPAHSPEVGVSLGGQGKVMSAKNVYQLPAIKTFQTRRFLGYYEKIRPLQLKVSR